MNGAQHTGVVVSAYDHAIDILLVQQFAVVIEDAPVGLAAGRRIFCALAIAIGRSDDFGTLRQLVDQQIASVPDADHANPDSVVRSPRPARQKQREKRAGHHSGRRECPSGDVFANGIPHL
jgi:hypothetical protein